MYDLRFCAFCRTADLTAKLVKYSVRHYAHPMCFYEKKGLDAVKALSSYQLSKFPVGPFKAMYIDVEALCVEATRREEERYQNAHARHDNT